VKNYPSFIHYNTPVNNQLQALFAAIPEENLLKSLKHYYAGRNGYTYKVLWHTYVAMVVLNLPSFAALIRSLHDNPYLAEACGINSYAAIPSKFAYSRFISKFKDRRMVARVKDVMRALTRKCYDVFPNFGKSVAIDATDLKAWANGNKRPNADTDAAWGVKPDTAGKKKFFYGYKLHVMADTKTELPIAAQLTSGNVHDIKPTSSILSEARFTNGKFHPDYVICDTAYSSNDVRYLIKRQYRAEPIIKYHPRNKKYQEPETKEWRAIYKRRTSVERLFGRLKNHRRLNNITVRSSYKVMVHCLIPLIVTQAMAIAFPDKPRCCFH